MKIRNIYNGDVNEVFNVTTDKEGNIIYKISSRPGAVPGASFFEGHPQFSPTARRNSEGCVILFLDSSWEVVRGKEAKASAKSGSGSGTGEGEGGEATGATGAKAGVKAGKGEGSEGSEGESATESEGAEAAEESTEALKAMQRKAAKDKDQQQTTDPAAAFLNSMLDYIVGKAKSGVMDEIGPVVAEAMKAAGEGRTEVVEFKTPWSSNKVEGVTIPNFKRICVTVMQDIPVYMYGPAGSGKSYAARQIAEAIGLDYYESSEVLFAHEMKGYGDAGGRYVETPFYNAFTKGGLFFLDEVDASAPEALVVLNNAIANKSFDFPVVGNKKAHENFRVIAAGNTTLTGADLQYTARQVQDTSFKNRFFFEKVDYCEAIELQSANGDREIVDFVHDLRQASEATRIVLTVSPRQCKQMANPYLNEVYTPAELVQCSVMQEKGKDEINILYNALKDKSNKWAKAMGKLC